MAAMPDSRRRSDEDAYLQRLANLSIEIRMLKARAQAALDGHDHRAADDCTTRTAPGDPLCPHCGHTAGLSLLPREYRRLSTPVRCFACQRDSAAFDWVEPASGAHNRSPDARIGRPHR